MKIPSLLLFVLLFQVRLQAQYERILNDPDVIWAAEINLDFWIEPEYTASDSAIISDNRSMPLKIMNPATKPNDEFGVTLASRLFELLFDEKVPVFARPDSLLSLTRSEREQILNTRDTVTVYDPVTYMEHNSVVTNSWSPDMIRRLRVRQLLYYNDKTDEFGLYTLAFAPLILRTVGVDEESSYEFIPFWFKMPPYKRKQEKQIPDLKDDNISWARRMTTLENMANLSTLHPFKDFKQPVMQQYLDRVRKDSTFKVLDGLDWKMVPNAQRQAIITRVDTAVVFDPETYEEMTKIIVTELKGEDLMNLRLVQDWYWDDKRKYPVFRLYAFAPLKEMKDEQGNFRFRSPVFWRLTGF